MRLGRVPRRYYLTWATSLLSLVLVALWPSTGAAIPLLPEETSGSVSNASVWTSQWRSLPINTGR